jgi:hypothetical protein
VSVDGMRDYNLRGRGPIVTENILEEMLQDIEHLFISTAKSK